MSARIRLRLTYANVMSTLAVLLLLSGGAAYAASHLGKNTVGSKQLKKNAVTTPKIKNNAINAAKIKNGSINGAKVIDSSLTGADVQDRSLTGADIDQASLNGVRAANVTAISINGDLSCTPAAALPSGVTSARFAKGECTITFPNSLTNCTATASIHFHHIGKEIIFLQDRTAQVFDAAEKPNVLYVDTFEEGTLFNLPFDLVVVC